MTKGDIFQSKHDNNKIEYCNKETHKTKWNAKAKRNEQEKLSEPMLVFKYIESSTKSGEIKFTETDFGKLIKMGNFVKV